MDFMKLILLIHISLGFLLVYFAARSYKRTKYVPMIYLTFGFMLITIGDTIIGDLFDFMGYGGRKIIEELVEISGFVLVIFAIIKS